MTHADVWHFVVAAFAVWAVWPCTFGRVIYRMRHPRMIGPRRSTMTIYDACARRECTPEQAAREMMENRR